VERAEYRHKLSGLLRAAAEPVTVRRRRAVAARKAEAMRWWLLLREEFERTAGAVGLAAGETRETSVELRAAVRDPFFLALAAAGGGPGAGAAEERGAGAGPAGILDGDGFVCPSVGAPAVAAHGVALRLEGFARAACGALLALADAHFPPGAPPPPPPPHSYLLRLEEQVLVVRRLAAAFARPCVEVGRHVAPCIGQHVFLPGHLAEFGLGTVAAQRDASGRVSFGIEWAAGPYPRSERVWTGERARGALAGPGEEARSALADGGRAGTPAPVLLAPPRTAALAALEKFAAGGAEGGPLLLVSGAPHAGKSVLLAQLVARALDGAPAAPGLPAPAARARRRATAFLFGGGEGCAAAPEAGEEAVLAHLAADVRARTGGSGAADAADARDSDVPGAGAAGAGALRSLLARCQGAAGLRGWGARALADAVVRAVAAGAAPGEKGGGADGGWEVVLVVDGVGDAAAWALARWAVALEEEVLAALRARTRRRAVVKLLLSAAVEPGEPLPDDVAAALARYAARAPARRRAARTAEEEAAEAAVDHLAREAVGLAYTPTHLPLEPLVGWERAALAHSALARLCPAHAPPALDHVAAIARREAAGSPLWIEGAAAASRRVPEHLLVSVALSPSSLLSSAPSFSLALLRSLLLLGSPPLFPFPMLSSAPSLSFALSPFLSLSPPCSRSRPRGAGAGSWRQTQRGVSPRWTSSPTATCRSSSPPSAAPRPRTPAR